MKSILQALYDGEVFPDELIVSKDPEYRPTHKKISAEKEYLKQKLSEEDYQRIEAIDNLFCQTTSMSAYEAFSYGFKLGATLLCIFRTRKPLCTELQTTCHGK